jgi:hypothetical protein
MTRRRTTLAAGLAVLLSLSVASGASALFGNDEDPELAFCQSGVAMTAAVASLEAIGADSTTDELQTAVDGVSQAASDMRNEARNLLESQVDSLRSAFGDLQGYVGSVDEDASIEDAVAGTAPYVAQIKVSRALLGTVDCDAALAKEAAEQSE